VKLLDVNTYSEPVVLSDGQPTFCVKVPSMCTHPHLHDLLGTETILQISLAATNLNISMLKGVYKLDDLRRTS